MESTRAAGGDFESEPAAFRGASRQDMATFDPDDVRQPTDFDTRPEVERGEAGEDVSMWLERQQMFAQRSAVRERAALDGVLQRPRGAELSVAEDPDSTFADLQADVGVDGAFGRATPFETGAAGEGVTDVTSGLDAGPFETTFESTGELDLTAEAEQEATAEATAVETEQTQELDRMFEQETESETETELETRPEVESELESEYWNEQEGDDEDDLFGEWVVDDEVFDTGTVQSLDEL